MCVSGGVVDPNNPESVASPCDDDGDCDHKEDGSGHHCMQPDENTSGICVSGGEGSECMDNNDCDANTELSYHCERDTESTMPGVCSLY
jgi:hypothetical protein